jgi:glycine betaine/choline ABC-type transport system substrate-binding protein
MGHVLVLMLQKIGLRPRVGLDGHESNHESLLQGHIDLYIEYTGTAQRRYLHLPALPREAVFETVKREAEARWDIRWCAPLGFDNTFAVVTKAARAESLGVTTVSELASHAPRLSLGAMADFFEGGPATRFAPGGYEGFRRAYRCDFGRVLALPDEYGGPYDALHRGDIDAIVHFPLHPSMITYQLTELEDDQGLFPSYEAAPVVRGEYLRAHPEAEKAIARLAGRVDNRTAARLNYEVEVEGVDPRTAAMAFVSDLL